jgi:hypothetical protein
MQRTPLEARSQTAREILNTPGETEPTRTLLTASNRDQAEAELEAQETAQPELTESTPLAEQGEQLAAEMEEMQAFISLAERAFNLAEEVRVVAIITMQAVRGLLDKS